jgi:hypothetical protein
VSRTRAQLTESALMIHPSTSLFLICQQRLSWRSHFVFQSKYSSPYTSATTLPLLACAPYSSAGASQQSAVANSCSVTVTCDVPSHWQKDSGTSAMTCSTCYHLDSVLLCHVMPPAESLQLSRPLVPLIRSHIHKEKHKNQVRLSVLSTCMHRC